MFRVQRCCCGCCTLKTGTLIIGIMFVFWGFSFLLGGIFLKDDETMKRSNHVYYEIVLGILLVTAGVFCIVATQTEKRALLIPVLVLAVINCLVSLTILIVIALYMFVLTDSDKEKLKEAQGTAGVEIKDDSDSTTVRVVAFAFFAVFWVVFFSLEVYFTIVVWSYYQELRDKQNLERQPQPQPRGEFE